MLVHCTSCNQQTEARINKKTGIVICALCQGEVQISPFAKKAMEGSGDYVEDPKAGFSFRCDKCHEIQPAVANTEGTKAFCTKCGSEISSISSFMIGTMRRMGKIIGKTEEAEE